MDIKINKVLCPMDFSDTSAHALDYALAFAQAHNAQLLLLHVVEIPAYTSLDLPIATETIQQFNMIATKNLQDVVDKVKKSYANVKSHLATGRVFYEVIQLSKEQAVDLIVVGTHGRSGIAHMLIGSEAEKIVRKAPCPVLTVKHPEHEFIMP